VRYYRPFVPPSPEEWRLTVDGLVTTPLTLTLSDVQQLPATEQESRMKCVEGWSFRARWAGFDLASLMQQVYPKEEAKYVHLTCADSYWEVLPIDDLLRPRVLFSYRMDGSMLHDEYGAPLRLIVPWKYGYKGAKCITRLSFVKQQLPGYWPSVGPYSTDGDIEPGYDYPQETGQRVQILQGGVELPY
jgi:sulfoxide reductase catalytic subunit YedY